MSVGVRNTLRINTVACAEAWSTGFAIVRSEELRRGDVGKTEYVGEGTNSSNDRSSSWRWQRGMGFGFRCETDPESRCSPGVGIKNG